MRRILLLGLVAALTACESEPTSSGSDAASHVKSSADDKVDFCLTLLHNNDGESKLLPLSNLPDFGGIARFAALVDQLRGAAESDDAALANPVSCNRPGLGKRAAILVSSGDNFLAGPEFAASLERGTHFDALALDLVGYDGLAIGNHEFDFGPDVFADFIEGFSLTRAPFLSANLDVTGEPRLASLASQGRIARSVVVARKGEKIGLIGLTTPLLPSISSPGNVVASPALVAAIQAQVTALEAKGVNKIVLLSHLQSVLEDLDLIPQTRGIDIVVAGGGSDLLLNPDQSNTPLVPGDLPRTQFPTAYPTAATDADGRSVLLVTTEGNYKYVGRLVAGFNKGGEIVDIGDASGPVRVAGTNLPDGVAPDPDVQTRVVAPVEAFVSELAARIVATSEVELDGRRSQVRTVETNLGNLVADALLWQARERAVEFGAPLPQVALQNGGGIRNDNVIPPGSLSELTTFSVLPFSNFLAVVPNLSREQFKELLENAVSRVEFTDGRFAQIGGFEFSYTTTGTTAQVVDNAGQVLTAGTRVRSAVLDDGTVIVADGVVQPGPGITIATIDFLANGGDQYPYRGVPFTIFTGVTYQLALENYLRTGLSGVVTAAAYPATPPAAPARITRLP
jgi:2',3'-cyclic-nucleotide 2'-phosphodiesterase (5'-nucleotidase family)